MLNFYKYCGAGNDFILLDNRDGRLRNLPSLAARLCQRHFSVGADGVIVVEAPEQGGDCKMRFFNCDGSPAEMCGNGARCLCRFCHDFGLSGQQQRIETPAGMVFGQRVSEDCYRVRLNAPSAVRLQTTARDVRCDYLELGENGIPHAALEADLTRDHTALRELARAVRHAPEFAPRGANVNLWQLIGTDTLRLLTFERGVEDFTLACGTGAGATVAALTLRGKVSGRQVRVHADGGVLTVDAPQNAQTLLLTGDACFVFSGELG